MRVETSDRRDSLMAFRVRMERGFVQDYRARVPCHT